MGELLRAARIKEMRTRLQRGMHSPFEGLAFQCLLFYFDFQSKAYRTNFSMEERLKAGLEALRTAAVVICEYEQLIADRDRARTFGRVGAFAAIHCLSHIVDAADSICEVLKVKHSLKRKEYWKVRNRHTHGRTKKHVRSSGDPEGFDDHTFALEATKPDGISYLTVGPTGYIIRSISFVAMVNELQSDLGSIFPEALGKIA